MSLLDRGLLTLENDKELDLKLAQKIFGFFDKSNLIDMFRLIIQGDEKKVIENYRKIYDQGVEPKIFINDFLELIYYFKNINLLTLESTNFSLNDEEFSEIKKISNNLDSQILILFWQFTIRTIEELDIVSNQNLSIEMFLTRLMHLSSIKEGDKKKDNTEEIIEKTKLMSDYKSDTVDQIKNVIQEKKTKPEIQSEVNVKDKITIEAFDHLLTACSQNKEMKLKYELEKNVNLVSFEQNRIEISFNDNLDKNFVKDLSLKLFDWTGQRWIISFSKTKGEISIKEKQQKQKIELLERAKNSKLYENVLEKFPDAKLVDLEIIDEKKD